MRGYGDVTAEKISGTELGDGGFPGVMRRRLFRIALVTTALVAALLGVVAVWLHSDDARRRFEAVASEALDREVRVSSVEVGWASLTLHDLTLADPWAESPAVSVGHGVFEVEWTTLLAGGLKGRLRADEVSVIVRKRDGATNFHGIRRPRSSKRPLDVSLALEGGQVLLHDEDADETVEFEGVSLHGRVTRSDAQPVVALDAGATMIRARSVAVHDVAVELAIDADGVALERARVRLGEGLVAGRGTVRFDAESHWSAQLDVAEVGLRDELFPLVVAAFPGAAGLRSAPEGATAGTVSLQLDVQGAGFVPVDVLPSLEGKLSLRLDDVVLPRETAVVRVASLLGRPAEPMRFDRLEADARVRGRWVRVDEVRHDGQAITLPFDGRVSLDGRLDLEVDVLALMRALPSAHEWARRYVASVPIRVEGTTDEPIIRPPPAGVVARSLATAWIERRLP